CTKAKTNPENMIHVGDDYEKDYLGALRSGLRAVLIDRAGKHQEEGLLKIMNLTELPGVIRGLSR
ncbi:MAG: HAD hydrolase-like protein, partial [Candidatus Bathyarchaeia archaeon]